MWKRGTLAALFLLVSACAPRAGDETPAFVPGEVLVRLLPGVSLPAAHHDRVLSRLRTAEPLLRVRVPHGTSVEEAVRAYESLPGIVWAEPNWIVTLDAVPDDPLFPNQWSLENIGQTNGTADADVNASAAWDLSTGDEVVLAVIDTGVEYSHVDLSENMWVNPGEIAGNGIDDDANGYVDDIHGINAISADGDPMDDHFHGTHVSGILAARGNNGLGVSGVSPRARVLACKFIASNGSGTLADALTCLEYVRNLKTRAQDPVDVIATNNSWGGLPFTRALHEAIAAQQEAGILFVAAAGNSAANNDAVGFYPAGHFLPNVIAVASTDHLDALSSFSSFGRRTVHVAAPGSAILSTFLNDGYVPVSGTSMAAPHVTGLLGLLKAQDPARDWRALRNLALTGGTDLPVLSATTVTGRRMRAADAGGVGSLTCADRILSTRLRPLANGGAEVVARGGVTGLAAFHLDCANAAGAPPIAVVPTSSAIALGDDGAGFDGAAGDGLYSAEWIPPETASFDLEFPGLDIVTLHALDPYRAPVTLSTGFRIIAGTPLGVGDEGSVSLSAPFPLRLGNHPTGFNEVRVYGNGHLSLFDAVTNTRLNATLPVSTQQTVIAPFWDDLQPATSGACGVFWGVLGTAGNQELVVEWRDIPRSFSAAGCPSPSGTVTFQAVFFESDSSILFNYADVDFAGGTGPFDGGASATVGVQVGASAVQSSFNLSVLSPGTSLLWSPGRLPVADPPVAGMALEGGATAITSSFTDADGDGPWSVEWDLDYNGVIFTPDGTETATAAGAISTTTVFPDDGARRVAVRVRDAGGLVSSPRASRVTVANVLPAVGALGGGPAREGTPLLLEASFVDPGPDGPWAAEWDFSYDGAGFSVEATDVLPTAGALSRSVVYPQDGAYTVALRIREREGAVSPIATATVQVTPETAPGAPSPLSPAFEEVVTTDSPSLVVANAADADGDAVTHRFELDVTPLFSSPSLVASQELVSGTAGTTSFTVTGLTEDAVWYWRARASDGESDGPWAVSSFRVNASNAAPSAPVAIGPTGDALVHSTMPTLRISNASDVDGDVLTYAFELRNSKGARVAPVGGVAAGANGETSWTVTQALRTGATYTWTATANDGTASGPPSIAASFTVYPEPSGSGCGCNLAAAGEGPRTKGLAHLAMLAIAALAIRVSLRSRNSS